MIDVKGLQEAFDNDWELIRELVSICKEKVPEYVNNVELAVKANNFEQLESHAHKLKGSIAHFGCQTLYDCVYQLELSGREKKGAPTADLLKVLLQEFEGFKKSLEELGVRAEKGA